MAPKFVTPYRMSGKRGKNDAQDAAAICEAVTRPKMRFVPMKEEQKLDLTTFHARYKNDDNGRPAYGRARDRRPTNA